MCFALNPTDSLVKTPLFRGCRAISPDLGGKLRPEASHTIAECLAGHCDAAFFQKVFDITQALGEPMAGSNGDANEASR